MLIRCILLKTSLLLVLSVARGESYEYDGSDDSGEDNSHYTSDSHETPDYSKYYSVDSSSPSAAKLNQESSGFVNPAEFSTFFGSPSFGFGSSSNNQDVLKPISPNLGGEAAKTGFVPSNDFKVGFSEYDIDGFGTQDFFEHAQKEDNKEDEDEAEDRPSQKYSSKPGPSYISHKLPAYLDDDQPSEYSNYKTSDKPIKQKSNKNKHKDVENVDADELEENSGFKPSNIPDYGALLNLPAGSPSLSSKFLADTSKASYPYKSNSNLYEKLTNTQPSLSPQHQKYSFQPVGDAFGLKTDFSENYNPKYAKLLAVPTVNYEYQPSEQVSQNIKGKQCVKLSKEITDRDAKFNSQPMNCFVCKDPKTGGKTEHCSYTSEPSPKGYYTSKTYGDPENYRSKRDESESYVNPYEKVKAKAHKYYSIPEEFEKEYYQTPDFQVQESEQYHFDPKSFINSEAEDKSYSEIQSEELVKDKDNCKKVSKKEGVTCTVCRNAKTGGNYEQCSYESVPNEKSYAYVRQQKFDGDGEEEDAEGSEPNPTLKQKSEAYYRNPKSENLRSESDDDDEDYKRPNSKRIEHYSYEIPRHFEETTQKQRQAGVRGLDPALYGTDSSEKSEKQAKPYLDDYHLKLFPQFSKEQAEESQVQQEEFKNPYFEEAESKKDVEEVLAEFMKKDRSNCKHVTKKGMTCYLCVDKKGIQQEECMYVSESRPQSSHVAYHEVQHIKVPEKSNITDGDYDDHSEAATTKRKRFFKKAPSQDSESAPSSKIESKIKFIPEAAASSDVRSVTKFRGSKKFAPKGDPVVSESKKVRTSKSKVKESEEPQPDFDVNDEDGYYTAETQPVFSKTWELSLPKYMLETSEHEKVFDELVASV